MNWLSDLLRDPSVENVDENSADRLSVHKKIFTRKPMIRRVFCEFHSLFDRLDHRFCRAGGGGLRLEIGAGVAPMRDSYHDVLATDIVHDQDLDRVLDAENMDLDGASVRVVFAQNCFHHLPHPESFFKELERVLVNGGVAILLEPYYGLFAAFLYRRIFRSEGYDEKQISWETPVTGPMKGANQALSYIVFKRDRAEFERRFPFLKIVHQEVCRNYLEYLLSGGLNFRQLCPKWAEPLVSPIQRMLSPFDRWLALHHIIVIRKEVL